MQDVWWHQTANNDLFRNFHLQDVSEHLTNMVCQVNLHSGVRLFRSGTFCGPNAFVQPVHENLERAPQLFSAQDAFRIGET